MKEDFGVRYFSYSKSDERIGSLVCSHRGAVDYNNHSYFVDSSIIEIESKNVGFFPECFSPLFLGESYSVSLSSEYTNSIFSASLDPTETERKLYHSGVWSSNETSGVLLGEITIMNLFEKEVSSEVADFSFEEGTNVHYYERANRFARIHLFYPHSRRPIEQGISGSVLFSFDHDNMNVYMCGILESEISCFVSDCHEWIGVVCDLDAVRHWVRESIRPTVASTSDSQPEDNRDSPSSSVSNAGNVVERENSSLEELDVT